MSGAAPTITTGKHARSPGWYSGLVCNEDETFARRLSWVECARVMGLSTHHLGSMIRDGILSREDAIALIGDSIDVPSLRAALQAVRRAMANKALRDSVS